MRPINGQRLIIILLGIIIILVFFLVKCGGQKTTIIQPGKPVKQLVQQVILDSSRTAAVLDSMTAIQKRLDKNLQLEKSKHRQAVQLVDGLLLDMENLTYQLPDTCSKFISAQIAAITRANNTKDSLAFAAINAQDSIIKNLAAQNEARQELYTRIRSSFNDCIAGSMAKDTEIRSLKKDRRNHKAGKTFFKIAAAAATLLYANEKLK